MLRRKVKVLIVEDSALYREYLKRVIESDAMLTVAGTAGTAAETLRLTGRLKPDVITLDLGLPDVQKFELLSELVRAYSVPIIVVSALPETCEEALMAGARDYIEKIQANDARSADQFELLLRLKIKTQANTAAERPRAPLRSVARTDSPTGCGRERLIVMGASLGGTEVIMSIMRQLPVNMPGIVIVQHMPQSFTKAYAIRLNQYSAMTVREAADNEPALPGTALVAPGGRQLTVIKSGSGYRVRLGDSEKRGGFCPSVDVLFHSAAAAAGRSAVGVILTGMGRDGAEGIKEMRDVGAYTIGQSRTSCAVFGMPAAAESLGGLDSMLNPDEIVKELIRVTEGHKG